MPVQDFSWIEEVVEGVEGYVLKHLVLDVFDLLFNLHGDRVRLFDAVRKRRADYVDLRLTLRWAMMSQADGSEQIEQVSWLYSQTTESARRWFGEFTGQLGEFPEMDADTLARWYRRLNQVGVVWRR
jgi:hypothetical protein